MIRRRNVSARCEKAADAFFKRLFPSPGVDSNHPARFLIVSAFALYDAEPKFTGSAFKIDQWKWPFLEADKTAGPAFVGEQPWTILLRRAFEMARGDAEKVAIVDVVKVGNGYDLELTLKGDGQPERKRCIRNSLHRIEIVACGKTATAALLLAGYKVS